MKKLLCITMLLCTLSPLVKADEYSQLSREYNRVFKNFLREKVEKLPKNSIVEIFFKDKTSIKGTYLEFCESDDGVWILPIGEWGWFSREAYDLTQILDVKIIVKEQV